MRSSLVAALIAAALLAGCGGGGGTSPSAPQIPGSDQSGGTVSTLSTQDSAQAGTDSAFAPVNSGEADVSAGTISGVSLSSSARRVQSLPVGHGCKNRTTRTVTVNPDGSVVVETIRYYDDKCTQVERDDVATYKSSGGTATIARVVTTFNQNHLQLGVRKSSYALTGSTSNGSWVVTSAFYPGTSTTPLSQFGHAASISSSNYTASTGRIVNNPKPSINASFGHQGATNATISVDAASNDTTFTGTHNGESFKAALNGLTLSAAPPFTISGGTQLGSSALTGSITFDPEGNLVAISLTGTLAGGNKLVVTSSAGANGNVTVNGTITSPSGAPVATFQTDASGNGILTLANGTQVPIIDWHVVW